MMHRNGLLKAAVAGTFAAGLAVSMPAQAALVDFNTEGQLESDFNLYLFPDHDNYGFTWGSNVGVGGSGGLDLTANNQISVSLAYNQESYDFTQVGTAITVSMFFKTPIDVLGTTNVRNFDLGFMNTSEAESNQATFGHNNGHLGVRVRTNNADPDTMNFIFRNNNSDATASGNFAMNLDHWYKLSFTATNVGDDLVDIIAWLDDYGSAGTSLVAANVFSHDQAGLALGASSATDLKLTQNDSIAAGFFVRDHSNNSEFPVAMDNFGVDYAPIPEPASLALLGLGMASLLARRRRA